MNKLSDFDYFLPADLIAQSPLNPRDKARLLHISNNGLNEHLICHLPSILRKGDLLIANDTKVIPAQLHGKINDKNIGFTLHKQKSVNRWLAFAKPAKRCTIGSTAVFGDGFEARVVERYVAGEIELEFNCSDIELTRMIEIYGKMPLPPYIKRSRDGDKADFLNY